MLATLKQRLDRGGVAGGFPIPLNRRRRRADYRFSGKLSSRTPISQIEKQQGHGAVDSGRVTLTQAANQTSDKVNRKPERIVNIGERIRRKQSE